MKTVTFQRACQILSEAYAVGDDMGIMYATIEEGVIRLESTNEDGEADAIFRIEENENVEIASSSMWLNGKLEGDCIHLTILEAKNIEA